MNNCINKSSNLCQTDITNSIFTNVFNQQFPNLISKEKSHDNIVNILTIHNNKKKGFILNKESMVDFSNNLEIFKLSNPFNNLDIKKDKNLVINEKAFKNENIPNKIKKVSRNRSVYDEKFMIKRRSANYNDNSVFNIKNEKESDDEIDKTLNSIDSSVNNKIINTENTLTSEKCYQHEKVNKNKFIFLSNSNHSTIHYSFDYNDCFSNPYFYYLTRFNYLLNQWKINGRVDSRYENLLDDVINEIKKGKYKLPPTITKRYKPDFSKMVGSGSNGRIFHAVDMSESKEVVLKITLSIYGSKYEEEMLKYCNSKYTVNLIESFNDQMITVFVMDLFGIVWSPENEIINPSTHEGLDYNFFKENSNKKEKRINYRDLYACAKIHKFFPDNIIKIIMKQLVVIINYFHTNLGVTHGDIKLQNILINQNYEIRITDFSAVRFIKDGKIKHFSGATLFTAPEALNGNFDGRLNDIWAIGIIFYLLLFGINKKVEFDKEDINSILIVNNNINKDAIDLLNLLLTHDHSKRPFIDEILKHKYFNS